VIGGVRLSDDQADLAVIAVNDLIGTLGPSGSARSVDLICDALEQVAVVRRFQPERFAQTGGLKKAVRMVYWDLWGMANRARRESSRVIIHPTNIGHSGRIPDVLVIHDLMVIEHPELFSRGYRLMASILFRFSAKRAAVVVTPSGYSAQKVRQWEPKANVVAIPWPVQIKANEPTTPDWVAPRIVVVSSTDKHKRVGLALAVVMQAREALSWDFRVDAVLRPGNEHESVMSWISQNDPCGEWITVHRDVSAEFLDATYQGAFCSLTASIDEGYGLPVVEAAAFGVPPVHLNSGALKEFVPAKERTGSDEASLLQQLEQLTDSTAWSAEASRALASARRLSPDRFSVAWRELIARLSEQS